MGTILTSLVLTGIAAAIIHKIHRNRKSNKCAACSYGNEKNCVCMPHKNGDSHETR